ncbi:UDP-N-acetylmuramoyl-tripeptide--D-alanyl-D-alanine ligase [Paenibacillus yanchengensis]|uniref:UDP-N-acetylmuramoyl-tripeptide--D-alanyl-D-alanine ligase n=1 Tax=Paenibacillus yanchengensis TaxID=2035833 RepID=A0ABW4YKH0_9BACL
MIKRTLKQVAEMCGGNSRGFEPTTIIEGVAIDSRSVRPGQLFVPIVGERFDGHQFAKQAMEQGASAMLWQANRSLPEELTTIPRILVKDTLIALQQLAKAYRSELMTRVIGVTGSNGKTTTKDLLAAVLATVYDVHKTEGNLNNEIGLPLTILQLAEETEVAVLEMGMSEFGEIELLSNIAQPDAAIITNIGESHMVSLGSRAGIAKAKLEIITGLNEQGLLLINGDDDILTQQMQEKSIDEMTFDTRTFGLLSHNDWSAAIVALAEDKSEFNVYYNGESSSLENVVLKVPGKHNISNALAVIAAARFFGVSAEKIKQGLLTAQITGMRIESTLAFNGAKLFNDCYNASPSSVKAAIDYVAGLSNYKRRFVVLGDMLDLGEQERNMHEEIGEYVVNHPIDVLLGYGPLTVETIRVANEGKASSTAYHFQQKEQLVDWLKQQLTAEDVVLVKGSRGMQMEEVVTLLEKG